TAKSASAKQRPSHTGYATKNWPDSGWLHEKAEPSGSVFFALIFSGVPRWIHRWQASSHRICDVPGMGEHC
ncbi:MAG: hypothetical protein RR740_14175, partial [Pseudomonas sp.]